MNKQKCLELFWSDDPDLCKRESILSECLAEYNHFLENIADFLNGKEVEINWEKIKGYVAIDAGDLYQIAIYKHVKIIQTMLKLNCTVFGGRPASRDIPVSIKDYLLNDKILRAFVLVSCVEGVKFCLEAGASIHDNDYDLAELMIAQKDYEVLQATIEHYSKSNVVLVNILKKAIMQDNTRAFNMLMKCGIDLNNPGVNRPLSVAITYNSTKFIKKLIKKGANVNFSNGECVLACLGNIQGILLHMDEYNKNQSQKKTQDKKDIILLCLQNGYDISYITTEWKEWIIKGHHTDLQLIFESFGVDFTKEIEKLKDTIGKV